MNAQTFYGNAYTPERAALLDKAFKYLDMAIRSEALGAAGESKVNMAFSAALKAEAEAFAA